MAASQRTIRIRRIISPGRARRTACSLVISLAVRKISIQSQNLVRYADFDGSSQFVYTRWRDDLAYAVLF